MERDKRDTGVNSAIRFQATHGCAIIAVGGRRYSDDIHSMIDSHRHNRDAWDAESRRGSSPWCQPVDESVVNEARNGHWEVILTPKRSVPLAWFDGVEGKRVLCLASGGGQQAPILAAAGATVTSYDISKEQLAKDELVAKRDGLDIDLVQGDMTDLSCFGAERFDLVNLTKLAAISWSAGGTAHGAVVRFDWVSGFLASWLALPDCAPPVLEPGVTVQAVRVERCARTEDIADGGRIGVSSRFIVQCVACSDGQAARRVQPHRRFKIDQREAIIGPVVACVVPFVEVA